MRHSRHRKTDMTNEVTSFENTTFLLFTTVHYCSLLFLESYQPLGFCSIPNLAHLIDQVTGVESGQTSVVGQSQQAGKLSRSKAGAPALTSIHKMEGWISRERAPSHTKGFLRVACGRKSGPRGEPHAWMVAAWTQQTLICRSEQGQDNKG